jgi:uncharacterized protein YoaH (UPF0181 family)
LTPGGLRAILPAFLMRLSAALLLVALAACGKSACQELGERICSCQPGGLSSGSCTTLVEQQLKTSSPGESRCQSYLDSCKAPPNVDLCEFMLTPAGKIACGLTPPPPPP